MFLRWLKSQSVMPTAFSCEQLDDLLCQFIQHVYDEREGMGKSIAVAAVYGVEMYLPRTKGQLTVAYRYLKGWDKLVPSKPLPPFTKDIVSAIAIHMAKKGQSRYALAVLLQFDCLLRVNELVNLRARDVLFRGESRLGSTATVQSRHRFSDAVLCFRHTKTGPLQSVPVLDFDVAKLLRFSLIGKRPDDFLFPAKGDSKRSRIDAYRKALKSACRELGLSSDYNTHSCRHGGATHLYHNMLWSLEDIRLRGRWRGQNSAAHYIQAGVPLLAQYKPPDCVASAGALFSQNLLESFALAQSVFARTRGAGGSV